MTWEIFEPVASRYEAWYGSGTGRRVDRAERALLDWMLACLPRTEQVLEVGWGRGTFLDTWRHDPCGSSAWIAPPPC